MLNHYPGRESRYIDLIKWYQAKKALKEVFQRFDVTGAGGLSRADYDLIVMCTDGEPSDDDTWAYISGSHQSYKHGSD